MTRHRMQRWLAPTVIISLLGCAGHVLQHERASEVLKVEEYEQKVQILENNGTAPQTTPNPPGEVAGSVASVGSEAAGIKAAVSEPDVKPSKRGPKKSKKKSAKPGGLTEKDNQKMKGPRQPTIEDSVGFDGRRPLVDPFRVGEKVTLNLSYFNVVAGQMFIEVKPFATVNGEKAYHFEVSAKSNSFFDRIYAVDDKAVTYLSYDRLVPYNLVISIKESKQLAETRTFFDWKNNKASYWKKRFTKEHGEESKKLEWDIQPYGQNVVSAAYYLRTFQIEPGKKLAFRVADEGKNIVFTGEVLRRETLDTPIGPLKTVVIKPQITVDGIFTPVGEILMWLTDDDRKFLVRMESKIKIGTVVAKLASIERGG